MSSIEQLFLDKQYCFQEMVRMREAWGSRSTLTWEIIDASRRVLGFMQLYAPQEIQTLVDGAIIELGRREVLCLFRGHVGE